MCDFSSLAPIIESMAGGAIGSAVLSGPLNSLNDWWYYHFGSKTELQRKRVELLNEKKIEDYKKDIFEEVKTIPADSIKEPQLDIIGPALEASKYYIEEPELRQMFAKLVSSSMDVRKEGVTRSAFVEFVKQMTPIDAKLLMKLSKKKPTSVGEPIVKINRTFKNGSTQVMESEIVAVDFIDDPQERPLVPSSIINLSRLGLTQISYREIVTNFNYDKVFSITPEYKKCKNILNKEHEGYRSFLSLLTQNPQATQDETNNLNVLNELVNSKLTISNGILSTSKLGKDFISICL